MERRHREMLESLRSVVEDDTGAVLDKSKDLERERTKCPPGFKFDGKHCVSSKKPGSDSNPSKPGGGDDAGQEGPPDSGREDQDGEFPNTRHHDKATQDKDIPLVPDPDHEIMQRPHNAITYADGKRSFEYAEEEWKEYAHNSFVMSKFPDAFATKQEFISEFLSGDHGMTDDWSKVQNCSAVDQKKGDCEGLIQQLWAFKGGDWTEDTGEGEEGEQERFKEYVNELIKKAKKEDPETTPPVVVGLHKDSTTGKETLWLLTGNSRALVYAFLAKPAPTRIVPLKGRMLPDPTDDELHGTLWPAEQASDDDEGKEQNVRAAVQQVIQNRGAPQESVWRTLRQVFENDSGASKRKHPSGYTKRLYRKYYKELGYPVGTVRNWGRGKMVKTAKGWEPVPEGAKVPKPASPEVPAAKHDSPPKESEPTKAPAAKVAPKAFPTPAVDPGKPADQQADAVYSPPADALPDDGHWIEHIPGFPKQTIDRHYEGWKKPKAYRQKLHDLVLGRYFDKVPAPTAEELKTKKPVAIMLMGGPASGKSTIGGAYPDSQFVHLDADAMKEHIPEYKIAMKWRARNAAKMAHEESVHLMQQLREKTIAAKKNLVMDGSGRHVSSYLTMMQRLKDAGYHVKVVMADLDQPTAMKRAKLRGKTSGRLVPPDIFDAAYHAVPRNFQPIADAGDEFELWDTRPNGAPELRWEKTAGQEKIHDPEFVKDFQRKNGSHFSHRSSTAKDEPAKEQPKYKHTPFFPTSKAASDEKPHQEPLRFLKKNFKVD